ncbi:MAG: hypothetical protein IH594_06695 [Bacteroidales bacterium]|nr:hypothetical protein [Bacteroidales bacterium]
MQTLSIEEILSLGDRMGDNRPALENYFSPTRKEKFVKDYIHYLNTCLLEAKHGNLDMDLYLVLVLSFQFIAPLLQIHSEKELGLFYRILQQNYDVESPDISLHFTTDEYDEGMIGQEEALRSFQHELENSWHRSREVKESVQDRLKMDGIAAIMNWQQTKELPELAGAFGRSIVIPSFFSFKDKKLIGFYQRTTRGISYEVAVPDFEQNNDARVQFKK